MSKTHLSNTIYIPPPGSGRSVFFIAPPKSGSTFVNAMLRALRGPQTWLDIPSTLWLEGQSVDHPQHAWLRGVVLRQGYLFGGWRSIPRWMPNLGARRKILLFRDPRDMLVSNYFSTLRSHGPPPRPGSATQIFSQRRLRAEQQGIDEFVLGDVGDYGHLIQQMIHLIHTPDTLVLRYEELVFRKLEALHEIVAWLGYEVPENRLRQIAAHQDRFPAEQDPSQHIRAVVPGDHRAKLRPDTISLLNARLEEPLRLLRYPL